MSSASAVIDAIRSLADHSVAAVIEAAVVGGSVGRGLARQDSDLDLFLLVASESVADFLAQGMRKIAECAGHVSLFRGPVFVEGFGYSFTVLYDLNFICQFNINTIETLIPNHMWNPHSQVLFDRTGHYTALLSKGAPTLDTRRLFHQAFTFFWLRAMMVAKYWRRGNLWAAIANLHDLRTQMMVLHRLSVGVPPLGFNYAFPAKGWEQQMTRGSTIFLEQTLCEYDPVSLARSLRSCLAWCLNASESFTTAHCITFNDELDVARQIAASILSDIGLAVAE